MYSIICEHWFDSSHSFCHVIALLWESRHFCHNSGAAPESQLNDLKPVSPIHWALATQVHCERMRPPFRDASPLALCYTLTEYTLVMFGFAYNLNSFDLIITCGFFDACLIQVCEIDFYKCKINFPNPDFSKL